MPAIYVSTYARYTSGNLEGEWVDLDDYPTKDEFYDHIKELHAQEYDPEFMFQDTEGVPTDLVDESHIDDRLWEWLELDDRERRICQVGWEDWNGDASVEQCLDAYRGEYRNEAEWAEEFMEDTGMLSEMPDNLRNYIDFESYARDCELGGDLVFASSAGGVMVFNSP